MIYISLMLLGLLDDINEEKPLFLEFFENNWLPMDQWTDQQMDIPSYRDARTHLEMCGITLVCSTLTVLRLSSLILILRITIAFIQYRLSKMDAPINNKLDII